MKTLKGWITTTCLVAILMLSTMTANAGIIIAGRDNTPCVEPTVKEKVDYGIIIAGITGVIIAGFTGVIIAGTMDEQVDCGIIIAG
jgi:hypothetical protein